MVRSQMECFAAAGSNDQPRPNVVKIPVEFGIWNFCEIIVSFNMFKCYEDTEETFQWIKIPELVVRVKSWYLASDTDY